MEFWVIKILILLKFHLFISILLDFLFCYHGSCYHLIQIQKMIPATFWNSVNLRPIWWQYFCHGHQLIELYCENWQSMLNFGGLDMPQHIGKLGSIRAIEPSNLVLKMVILMFSGSSHFCLPLHLSYQNICKIQYMC